MCACLRSRPTIVGRTCKPPSAHPKSLSHVVVLIPLHSATCSPLAIPQLPYFHPHLIPHTVVSLCPEESFSCPTSHSGCFAPPTFAPLAFYLFSPRGCSWYRLESMKKRRARASTVAFGQGTDVDPTGLSLLV